MLLDVGGYRLRGASRFEDSTDRFGWAFVGHDGFGVASESVEFGSCGLELFEATVDVSEMVGDEGLDMCAGSAAAVADVEDCGDFPQGEAGGLGALHEAETGDGGFVVVAIPVGGSALGREEAAGLVEAKRLGCHSDAGGEFSDEHAWLPLDLPPYWKPYRSAHGGDV